MAEVCANQKETLNQHTRKHLNIAHARVDDAVSDATRPA